MVQSDNAKGLLGMRNVLKYKHIKLTMTSALSLDSNGEAKRMDGTVLKKTRIMIKKAGMPNQY